MIVDFFRHGSGLSKPCLDYLLGEDREREHAQVLSGDVELTAQLIDSSPFAKKYTSGCLSFYEHDLSDQDKQQIMQNFERCLFPGLDKDQYQILWVQHQDKINYDTGETRLELNFVIPNVELSTGKRLQPFYAPVDLDRVDLFKKITNAEHRLYDPDDPNHQQLLINKKNLPKDVKDFRAQLHQRICQAVVNGKVADRQELVQWLESNAVKVTRQTQKSISIENPYKDAKRPIRLTGEIYEQGFRATGEYRQEVQQRIEEYRETTSERYRANVTEYQRQLEHKSQYHCDRYPTVGRESSPEHSKQRPDGREAVKPVSNLAAIQIEPFNAIERENTEPRTASPESSRTEKTYHSEYGTDFSSSYFAYSNFLTWSRHQKQIQRSKDTQYSDQREANEGGSLEQIGGQFDIQHMQPKQKIPTSVHFDQRATGQIRERLLHSNGVLIDDRARSAIIEDYRRTASSIKATTAGAQQRIEALGAAERNYRASREQERQFTEAECNLSGENRRTGKNSSDAEESRKLNASFDSLERELQEETRFSFNRLSERFENRKRSESLTREDFTYFSPKGNSSSIDAFGTPNEREARLSEQLSRKIRGFDTENIFKALDILDERKELQRVQESKNLRGYDPF